MTNGSTSQSRLRRILRWTPLTILSVSLLLCWGFVLAGGFAGVIAWLVLMQLFLLGAPSLLVTLGYAAWKRRLSTPVIATTVVSLLAIWPLCWQLGILPIAYPADVNSVQPSATVRLPADVPLKVAWGGDTISVNQHALVPDQRWAYDMMVEPYFTGSKNLEDYGCWDVPVVAPVSARVATAEDGIRDETPGEMNAFQPFGNHVFLQLPDTQTYLAIAHLKQGSVLVKEGDEVAEGQEIGRCGNSGHTSEPHIHIHHLRGNPDGGKPRSLGPINLAEGLPLFFRDHDGPPMPEGGLEVVDGKVVAIGVTVRHQGTP